jgi:hypothetical protein
LLPLRSLPEVERVCLDSEPEAWEPDDCLLRLVSSLPCDPDPVCLLVGMCLSPVLAAIGHGRSYGASRYRLGSSASMPD